MKFLSIKNNTSNTAQSLWVAIGLLCSVGFGLLSSVILSRFLPKAEYGTYQQVLYVYTTLQTLFTLGLPLSFSYFLPRMSKEQGKDTVRKINYLLVGIGLVFSLVLFIAAPIIGEILDNPALVYALKVFSPVPLFLLPAIGIDGIYASYRKTHISAIYTILNRIFSLACVAAPVMLWNGDYIDAIKGFVVASCLQFIVAMVMKNRIFKGVEREKSSTSFKEIMTFSLPLLAASLWGWLMGSADSFFISRYFGQEIFAEYANGAKTLPFVNVILQSTTTVLLPLLSKTAHEQKNANQTILHTMQSVFAKTAMLTYPLIFFCWFFAPEIVTFLFGEIYINSAIYLRIVLIANLCLLANIGTVMIAMGKNRDYARIHMWTALILIALEFVATVYFKSPYMVASVSALCLGGRYIVMLVYVARTIKVSFKDFIPWRLLLNISIPSILILAGSKCVIKTMSIENSLTAIVIGFVIYTILFFIWALLKKIDYLSIIKPFLKKN